MGKFMVGLARILSLCAFVLLPPALTSSQTTQPPPGWYKNSGPSIMYEAPHQNSRLRIVWENSYIYQHPGTDNLYWYAQVAYQNIGSQPLSVICPLGTDPSIAKEHIRGTQGIPSNGDASVAAEETFCSRNPNFSDVLAPGGTFYYWAIFHNVPSGGEVSLELSHDPPTRSAWVKPWYTPFSAPPPPVCPPELVTLNMCQSNSLPSCFRDQGDPTSTSGRDLNGFGTSSPNMTTATCINECRQRGFAYAGTQYSSWCFCGNSYGRFGPADNCNMPCSGNSTEICGGYGANSIYSTK